jgi:putative colanic acid biosynthesis UDP-glucose lipid carrier transferase
MRLPLRLSTPLSRYLAMGLDWLMIWSCAVGSYRWFERLSEADSQLNPMPALYDWVVLLSILVLMLMSDHVYRSWRLHHLSDMIRSVLTGWLVALLSVVVWLFLSKFSSDLSRLWFVGWAISSTLALCLLRALVYGVLHLLRRSGYNFKTLLLVGSASSFADVKQALAAAPWSGLRVQAALAPSLLEAYLADPQAPPCDEVWLCMSLTEQTHMNTALYALRHSTANIRLVPDAFSRKLLKYGVSASVGIPMLDISANPITGLMRLLKGIEDRLGALIILSVIAIPMLLIALAIKLTSKGPVFFKQLRHGWNGKEIWIYKFRSMVVHHEGEFLVTQASKGDARITPLGAFLRRTSLDELPQFINVLQGRMSIVGPRPHAVQHNEHYKTLVPGYMLRHKVKPGITGWAQINGYRGETDTLAKMQKRIEFDLYYIEHLSLWLDIKIIFLTLIKGWVHHNAY